MFVKKNLNKIFFNVSKINYYFERKNSLLIFLLLLIGVLIPALSGSPSNNFWYRLFSILNSPFLNFMYFSAIGLNSIYISSELSKSYNVVNRYSNYKNLITSFVKDVIITTIILSIATIVLSISGAILFSFGNITMIQHPYYNFPIVIYIIFYIIRFFLFTCILTSIVYLLSLLFNKISSIIIILVFSSFFMILPEFLSDVNHFYNMPLLFYYYFLQIHYSTIFLEIICSILQFFMLLLVYKIIYKKITIKKRDLN